MRWLSICPSWLVVDDYNTMIYYAQSAQTAGFEQVDDANDGLTALPVGKRDYAWSSQIG